MHVVTEGGRTIFTLVAYQPGLDPNAPLEKLLVLSDSEMIFDLN